MTGAIKQGKGRFKIARHRLPFGQQLGQPGAGVNVVAVTHGAEFVTSIAEAIRTGVFQ